MTLSARSKISKSEFMLDKLGEEYDGVITVQQFGLFVELDHVEGLAPASRPDYFLFYPERLLGGGIRVKPIAWVTRTRAGGQCQSRANRSIFHCSLNTDLLRV